MAIDFYHTLRIRIPGLADLSASSRGAMYREAIAAAEKHIADCEPALSARAAASMRLMLQLAIARIETEFAEAREKHGRHAPDWALPPEPKSEPDSKRPTDAALAPLAAGALSLPEAGASHPAGSESASEQAAKAQSSGPETEKAAAQQASLPQPSPAPAWPILAALDIWDEPVAVAFPGAEPPAAPVLASIGNHLRIIGALLSRNVKIVAGSERLAYFWLLVEPLMQVGLVVSLYWLFGRTMVYSMPAVPFAVIGVGAWLMFRTMLLRIATGLGREFTLCFFPSVGRLDVYLAKALFFGISYMLATFVMLAMAGFFELSPFIVKDPLQFLGLWWMIWLFSFGFALSMSYIFLLAPALKRLLLVIMRGLYLFSAVVTVTEQFSIEDKAIFLWNPLVHGMQLLRSYYFHEYFSDDASLPYFLIWTLGFVLLGLLCERRQRHKEITP